jgi:pimeloyl-ACP methyl ester carboxylesterase
LLLPAGDDGVDVKAQSMTDYKLPETHYAFSDDVSIAYQTMGDGPVDIIVVPGLFSHVEFLHEMPGYTSFLRRLRNYARVVTFDKRGQGLSDRISGAPPLEQRVDDVRAVMDAIGSRRAVLFGFSEGCPMSLLFAATHPSRVSHLILFGGFARGADRIPDDVWPVHVEETIRNWGTGKMIKALVPSQVNPEAIAQFAKFERLSSSPGALRTVLSLHRQIDVTSVLSSVRAPTLVLHRRTDAQVPVSAGRRLAELIPDARYIEYPDGDHYFWVGETETLLGDIEEFVTGHREAVVADLERVLTTVLFTDIVDSTGSAAAMGDRRWRKLLDSHDQLASRVISRHRGNVIKSTGDGLLATFDGPGRAVHCALAFSLAARQLGLSLRAGLHTGEIELRDKDIGGIAVHAAARVMAKSDANEVLVSRVVTDLVAGAGLSFTKRGSHELKGLPGRWDLFAAAGG